MCGMKAGSFVCLEGKRRDFRSCFRVLAGLCTLLFLGRARLYACSWSWRRCFPVHPPLPERVSQKGQQRDRKVRRRQMNYTQQLCNRDWDATRAPPFVFQTQKMGRYCRSNTQKGNSNARDENDTKSNRPVDT